MLVLNKVNLMKSQEKQELNEQLLAEFQELVQKAKEAYPEIEDSVRILQNHALNESTLQDYLSYLQQKPDSITTNQVTIR